MSSGPIEKLMERYEALRENIRVQRELAASQGKKLLILAGETHIDHQDLIASCVLLKAASQEGINIHGSESTEEMLLLARFIGLRDRNTTGDFQIPLADALGMEVLPFEKPDISIERGLSLEGIKEREGHHMNVIMERDAAQVVVTGQLHMGAYLNSQELQKQYHIMPLVLGDYEISNYDLTKEFDRFSHSRQAVLKDQPSLCIPEGFEQLPTSAFIQSLLTPEEFSIFNQNLEGNTNPIREEREYSTLGESSAFNQIVEENIRSIQNESDYLSPVGFFSSEDLSEAERISPILVSDFQNGKNSIHEIVNEGNVTLLELAEASLNNPNIHHIIRYNNMKEAIQYGFVDLEKLFQLTDTQMETLTYAIEQGKTPSKLGELVSNYAVDNASLYGFVNNDGPNHDNTKKDEMLNKFMAGEITAELLAKEFEKRLDIQMIEACKIDLSSSFAVPDATNMTPTVYCNPR